MVGLNAAHLLLLAAALAGDSQVFADDRWSGGLCLRLAPGSDGTVPLDLSPPDEGSPRQPEEGEPPSEPGGEPGETSAQEPAGGRPPLFLDPDDGHFDISGFLSSRTGFLPLPVPITEPAVGYGLALGLCYFHSEPKTVPGGPGEPSRIAMPSTTVLIGGAGLRYLIARRYGLRLGLDLAYGDDEWTVYVTVGTGWVRP